jgi:hypothetical protein
MNSISRVQPCVTEAQWNKLKARKNLVFVHFATVRHRRRFTHTPVPPVPPMPVCVVAASTDGHGWPLRALHREPYPIRRPGHASTCVDTTRRHAVT